METFCFQHLRSSRNSRSGLGAGRLAAFPQGRSFRLQTIVSVLLSLSLTLSLPPSLHVISLRFEMMLCLSLARSLSCQSSFSLACRHRLLFVGIASLYGMRQGWASKGPRGSTLRRPRIAFFRSRAQGLELLCGVLKIAERGTDEIDRQPEQLLRPLSYLLHVSVYLAAP